MSILLSLLVVASAVDQMTPDMVSIDGGSGTEDFGRQNAILRRLADNSEAGAGTGYREGRSYTNLHVGDVLGEQLSGQLSPPQPGDFGDGRGQERWRQPPPSTVDLLAHFEEEEKSVTQGLSDAQAKLRWAAAQLESIAQHHKLEFGGPETAFLDSRTRGYANSPQGEAFSRPLWRPVERSSLTEKNAPQEIAYPPKSVSLLERYAVPTASINGFMLVEDSLCNPRCQVGRGACARPAGRLLPVQSCICMQPFTGPTCAEIQRAPEIMALSETNVQTRRQRNPGFAALLFEPLLYGYSALSYAFFIFCTAASSAVCMHVSKSQPRAESVATRGAISEGGIAQLRSHLSAFFQYPGPTLNDQCAPASYAQNHQQDNSVRSHASSRRQEVWRPVAKKESDMKLGYVDDDSDIDADDARHPRCVN